MITFFNSFFNYIILLIVFVAAGAIGAVLGVFARKKKDASLAKDEITSNEEE